MATQSHSPREAPAATAVVITVAFVVLFLAVTRGVVDISSAFPNNGEEHAALESYRDNKPCAGYNAGGAVESDGDRSPRGHVDYLYLFHCVLGGGALGYAALAAWLAALFYLLGDTAAAYFCSSLEGLSRLLRLPPAVAGATLLSLGNGAPDALSAVASFASGTRTSAAVGLGGVLGGAVFVSAAVLSVVGLRLGGEGVAVDRASFFRDAGFLLVALAAVAVVLAVGEVNIWGAGAFIALYLVYVLAVAFTPDRWSSRHQAEAEHTAIAADSSSELHDVAETKFHADQEAQQPLLADTTAPLLQHYAGDSSSRRRATGAFWIVARALDFSLRLPRRLTIPDASKERWNKPSAVTAATLAPFLLSFLCRDATASPLLTLLIGGLAGISLGTLAFLTTEPSAPPTRFLAAWLGAGFAMSVAWAYVIAGEVLALLVAAGAVMHVDTAFLGVTVLAWGDSLGDLVTNVAVAGCYGGPVFNVLVGLGLSITLACWAAGFPRPVEVPREPGLFLALGFAAAGVAWAAVVLSRRGMRVDRTLGLGLLAIYFCFLCVHIWEVLGPKGRQ